MEAALLFLERLLLAGIGVFALYQCFQIADHGRLARPGFAWTVRFGLIAVAGLCFFTVARLLGTR
jgi:predicted Co/Zn/Cd cation transporter (cation efflux family)